MTDSPGLSFTASDSFIDRLFAETEQGFTAMRQLTQQQTELIESALESQTTLRAEVESLRSKVNEVDELRNKVVELQNRVNELESRGRNAEQGH